MNKISVLVGEVIHHQDGETRFIIEGKCLKFEQTKRNIQYTSGLFFIYNEVDDSGASEPNHNGRQSTRMELTIKTYLHKRKRLHQTPPTSDHECEFIFYLAITNK